VAHDPDGVQEPHEPPLPAITRPPATAEKSEIARLAFCRPHFGHEIGLSAADMARKASNFTSQS